MQAKRYGFIFLFFFATSFAVESTLERELCLKQSFNKIKYSMLNFNLHKDFDDEQKPDIKFLRWGIVFIRMVDSHAHKTIEKVRLDDGNLVDRPVYYASFKLIPFRTEQKPYAHPRFTLRCVHKIDTPTQLELACHLADQAFDGRDYIVPERFSVDQFEFKVVAQANRASCPHTFVRVYMMADTNSPEVNQIKQAISPSFSKIFERHKAFSEDKFFSRYYAKFLTGWRDLMDHFSEKELEEKFKQAYTTL